MASGPSATYVMCVFSPRVTLRSCAIERNDLKISYFFPVGKLMKRSVVIAIFLPAQFTETIIFLCHLRRRFICQKPKPRFLDLVVVVVTTRKGFSCLASDLMCDLEKVTLRHHCISPL